MCGVPLCPLIKSALHHYAVCDRRECELCKEVRRIAGMHIQNCKDVSCKVPHRYFLQKWGVCLGFGTGSAPIHSYGIGESTEITARETSWNVNPLSGTNPHHPP